MNLHTCATAAVLLSVLAGCVPIPLARTYFEPNPADGVLSRSASCGYIRTEEDELRRDIGGVILSVYPYTEGQFLKVHVRLRRTPSVVELDAQKFEVRFGDLLVGDHAAATTVKDAGPYFPKTIDYVVSMPNDAEEIALVFLAGFISVRCSD